MANGHSPRSELSTLSTFNFKRRANPTAAFAEMLNGLNSALREGGELAKAAELFKGGVFVEEEDAALLDRYAKRGMSASNFKVGALPPELGPGLALMYDAALEVLRSSDELISPDRFQPRSGKILAELVGSLVPVVGSASVTALEMASTDADFAGRLKDRAFDLTKVMGLDDFNSPDCEHCLIRVKREGFPDELHCGTKEECDALGLSLLLLLLLSLLPKLFDWLF